MTFAKTSTVILIGLAGCSWFGFGGGAKTTTMPGLGEIEPKALCSDVLRCEVRGDKAVSTLSGKNAVPINLAAGQGPESYLGKVAPKRNANSVLKTCGGDVSKDDWLETGPTSRTLELSTEGKQKLRAAIKGHLAEAVLAHADVMKGQTASIDSTVEFAASGAGLTRVGMLSQTFWLKDSAFERRVGQCGEENYADIIYSLTLLKLSDLSQKEIELKLVQGLESKLPYVAPETTASGDDPLDTLSKPAKDRGAQLDPVEAHHDLIRELAYGTVQALAAELRTIAALGFDEP